MLEVTDAATDFPKQNLLSSVSLASQDAGAQLCEPCLSRRRRGPAAFARKAPEPGARLSGTAPTRAPPPLAAHN